ncbi:cytochrome P450 [Mycolicibacterium chitae]|uniref:Cytochrome P450 n=1 Tax=Mycolicibacterium chitae TaxID=1792 RepID=A0A448I9Y7_MYCCI|nr:cytochrome P450 [Mycolicibacterium chitae]MCV7105101.1 cytochrome P450 [Mycolicibacterium chitae]BBZ05618.1 cytochrome P450 [Mycolicibacterium chitae]VEG49230.1 cytochrome P450 [Mycolicibacterium chitae]
MTAVASETDRRAAGQALRAARIPRPPKRVPLLGDILTFRGNEPTGSALDYAAQLGPIFEFTFMGARYVVAAGAEVVTDLNDEKRFCKHLGPEIVALRIVGGDGLFTAYNDEPNWRRAHELLMPAFTQAAMRRYHPTMVDVGTELTASWDIHADNGSTVEVSADTTRVTLETIGRCAAGYSFDAFASEGMHPFVDNMVAALRGSDKVGVLWQTYLPRFVANAYERRVRRYAANLHAIADDIIAARRAEGPGHHDDLLELMLTPDADGRPRLGEANIRYQLINFLIAGHETTSGALSFALYFLSTHPEVFARARAEVDQVWGEAQRPEFEQIAKLRYVRRVLDESLRLQPTVPGYYRQAREDTVLAGTYPVRKGEWVLALTGTLHRDPRWTGPGLAPVDQFDPDRFAPEHLRARSGTLYKPFGTGERSCIGRQFALHEAVLLLGMLIRRYDLVADPDYQLAVSERLTVLPKGFRLGLRRRS